MDIKYLTEQKVPVRLLDSTTGTGVTGVASGAVTVYLQPYDDVSAVKSVTGAEWTEVDAVNFPGVYDLLLYAGDVSALGQLKYSVVASGAVTYVGIVNVVEYLSGDIMTMLGFVNTNAANAAIAAGNAETAANSTYTVAASADANALAASVAAGNAAAAATSADTNALAASNNASIAATNATNAQIAANVAAGEATGARKLASNRMKINTTAKTCTVYDDDGTTPLYVWNLYDAGGASTATAIFERVPA